MPSFIVARDDEVLAIVADAANDQMDMGMFGVPMIDRDPLRAEVLLHLANQLAGEALEVGHLQRIIRADGGPNEQRCPRPGHGIAAEFEDPAIMHFVSGCIMGAASQKPNKISRFRGLMIELIFYNQFARALVESFRFSPTKLAPTRTV